MGDDEIHGEVCDVCRQAVGLGDAGEISEMNPGWDVEEFLSNIEKYEPVVNDSEESDRFVYQGECLLCDTWEGGTRWPAFLTHHKSRKEDDAVSEEK